MAEAAKRAEMVPLPLMVRHNSVREEYPPGLNPFVRGSRTASFMAPPQQQQQQLQSEVKVHAASPKPPPLPPSQQPQPPKVVAQPEVAAQPKVVAQPEVAVQPQPQPPKVVAQPEVAAQPKVVAQPQPQPPKIAVQSEVAAQPQPQQSKVVAHPEVAAQPQPQQPEVVVQPQRQAVKSGPKFSSAFNGIRARLEHIFEPRSMQQQKVVVPKQPQQPEVVAEVNNQQQSQQPEVVAETDNQQQSQQPEVVAETDNRQQPQPLQVKQQQPKSEVVYASLVFPQPKAIQPNEAVAASGQPTTTIQAPSMKRMRAPPPPPVLQKPKMPYAGISRVGTLPRIQKPPPPAEGTSSQAASNVALDKATPRAPPPPPQRRSSLRSLNSLRRARSVPMTVNFSRRDLPVQFLNDYDLWDEDECFVSYV